MKPNKPIILHIPALVIEELEDYLKINPTGFNYKIVYFYYVIHHLTAKQIRNKDKEYVFINKGKLRKSTVSNIDRYIKILCDAKIVLSDGSYIKGKKSLHYKLNPEYIKGISSYEIKINTKLHSKVSKELHNKKANNNRLEPHLKIMLKAFMNIDFDYDLAEKWIQQNGTESEKYYYRVSMHQLKDKRFRYFKRNKTNKRLDTNLTNLKRELRQFIKGDFISIDLKNAQPLLLEKLIKVLIKDDIDTNCDYLSPKILSETFGFKLLNLVLFNHQNDVFFNLMSLNKFSGSVTNGTFYEDFVSTYPEPITRDEVKKLMFTVLFSQNSIPSKNGNFFLPYQKEKEIFACVYPFIYKTVHTLKSNNHALLPVFLQRLESYIFIDNIAKDLVANNITHSTIHDSVIIERKYQDKALEIVKNVFLENFGHIPAFHIKLL